MEPVGALHGYSRQSQQHCMACADMCNVQCCAAFNTYNDWCIQFLKMVKGHQSGYVQPVYVA